MFYFSEYGSGQSKKKAKHAAARAILQVMIKSGRISESSISAIPLNKDMYAIYDLLLLLLSFHSTIGYSIAISMWALGWIFIVKFNNRIITPFSLHILSISDAITLYSFNHILSGAFCSVFIWFIEILRIMQVLHEMWIFKLNLRINYNGYKEDRGQSCHT